MGLDNIPREYPCATKATRTDGKIDCAKTQEANNCTWQNERENSPMVRDIPSTTGIFGTDCWYRGKYGNFLLDLLHDKVDELNYDYEYTFYGEGDDGLDTDYCFNMAEWMRNHTEQFAFNAKQYLEKSESTKDEDIEVYINDWIYAIWWLEFVGKTSNGSAVWW